MSSTPKIVAALAATVVILSSLSVLVRAAQQTGYQFPSALKTVELRSHCAGRYENLSRSVQFSGGDQFITVFAMDRQDTASPWNYYLGTFSTSYWIVDVGWRNGGNILYVAGIGENGTSIVEQWNFTPRSGGWAHTAPEPPPAIGMPSGAYQGTTTIVGGTYIQPPSETIPAPRRKVLYRGTEFGEIGAVAADPEGRFLILRSHTTKGIYRLDLGAQPSTPVQLFTSADIPHLDKATRMFVQSHLEMGRVCLIVDGAPARSAIEYTLLIDEDNDGLFEEHRTITKKDWLQSDYAIEALWIRACELDS